MRWICALAVGSVLGVCLGGSAGAQDDAPPAQPVRLSVEVGFRSRLKLNKWAPVRCVVENRSGKQLEGTLSTVFGDGESRQTYYVPVDLPSPARRRYTLYIRPQQQLIDTTVQLKADELVLTERVPTMGLTEEYSCALVLSRGALGLVAIAQQPGFEALEVVDGRIEDLPEKVAGYGPIDIIIWNGMSLRGISAAQERALRDWILSGGTLIAATGRFSQLVEGSVLESLLPVNIGETLERSGIEGHRRQVPRRGRRAVLVVPELAGPLLLTQGNLKDTSVPLIADESGVPLIAYRDMGRGTVVYLAFDLSMPTLLYHPDQVDLYQGLLQWADVAGGAERYQPRGTRPALERNAARQRAVYQTAVARAPSLFWVAVFLGVYVLVIGPVDYLVLRLCRRRHLTIITFPLIVATFTAASYYFASSFKGNRVFVNEITVLHERGDRVHARTHFGVYSPRKATYDIAIKEPTATVLPLSQVSAGGDQPPRSAFWRQLPPGGPGSFWPNAAASYAPEVTEEAAVAQTFSLMQTADAFGLPGTAVDMWAMRSFYADWWPDAGAVHARLRYEGGYIKGEITNGTRFDLENCLLLLRNMGHPLGTFTVGETRTVEAHLPLTTQRTAFSDEVLIGGIDEEERTARLAVLESLGLRPYNAPEARASYERYRNELQRSRRGLVPGSAARELAQADVAIVGWTREPLLPIEIEGCEPGLRAVNLWVLRPAYWGRAEPIDGVWEAPYLTPDPFDVRLPSTQRDFGREQWPR